MSATAAALSEQEKKTIQAALRSIRRSSPEAARIIARLVRASSTVEPSTVTSYASVREVALAFSVTDQTIRNWVDRGLMPASRHLGRGPRRIPRSVLASAEALARPRPPVPDFAPQEIDELLFRSPRKGAK